MANADGCDDGTYKRELALEFGVKILSPVNFLSDSLSTVMLHKDYYTNNRSKHIARAIGVLREKILTKVYAMHHIPGAENYSDIMTKPLPRVIFIAFRDAILEAKIVLDKVVALLQSNIAMFASKYARSEKQ